MRPTNFLRGFVACAAISLLAGCGSNGSPSISTLHQFSKRARVSDGVRVHRCPAWCRFKSPSTASLFPTAAIDGVNFLQNPQTIDFARYNGLQTLLDFNSVPAGTYNTVTRFSLSKPDYFLCQPQHRNTSRVAHHPHRQQCDAHKSDRDSAVQLANSFTVTAGQAAGLRMDFDLRQIDPDRL